ncbi:hypothetical protein CASFOL_020949 [Castilleja foliolosa]|uniref:Cullin N-terminal domain-containing protein n=1 Tax=Castilleja foliolosa TaxID=1961234 RepID=A0ABD3D354_9LAMI
MRATKACYTGDKKDENAAVKAVQVCMVHLCKSARFKLIQDMIERTFMSTIRPILGGVLEELEHDDLTKMTYYMKQIYVDLHTSVEAPHETELYIKKFRQLSEAWYVYALSRTDLCPINKGTAVDCGLLDGRLRPDPLNETLGVLCNCNVEGLLDSWSGSLPKVDGIESYFDFPLDKHMLKGMRKENDEIRRSEKKPVEKKPV